MKTLRGLLFKGLAAVLPLGATIYIIYWLGSSAEALLGRLIKLIIPEAAYWPGMGLITGLALLLLVGLLVNAWVIRRLLEYGERLLGRIPVVKTLYGALRDFMHFFTTSRKGADLQQVVTAQLGEATLIGFVTRDPAGFLPNALEQDLVAVYFPMSYQIGGYTLYLPRQSLTPLEMSVEQAMGLVLTAGVTSSSPGDTKRVPESPTT